MGLFKKKSDPLSERAQALAAEIAALEAQIKRLNEQEPQAKAGPPQPAALVSPPAPAHASSGAPASGQPKLRSTALPHHRQPAPPQRAASAATREPVFEHVDQNRLQSGSEPAVQETPNVLDVRKNGLGSVWRRFTTHFRGPATSNPKLVNYLAAGSIQGLRPLRYERRVARNRTIVLVLILVFVLWGVFAIFWKSHR